MLDELLKNTTVLGAAGKMGRGIAFLLLEEIVRLEAEKTGDVGSGKYRLLLIDSQHDALEALRDYLEKLLWKSAEKNIVKLRQYFSNNAQLVSNEEIVRYYVQKGMRICHFDLELSWAKDSRLVFEAIVEDLELKAKVLSQMGKICSNKTYFFTNTSSIPISEIDKAAHLEHRIIGFHFYNPPPIQKLVELITNSETNPELVALAKELGKRLKKLLIHSNDVAGFIGNGHFMRDLLFACDKVEEFKKNHTQEEAIYIVNKITQDYLLRPMGIFQLADYVGIDVCQKILHVMSSRIPHERLHHPLIDKMLQAGVKGGQYSDGTQKDGFFHYQDGVLQGVYSFEERRYKALNSQNWVAKCEKELGPLPQGHIPWKKLLNDRAKDERLKAYFGNLFQENSLGANFAKNYLLHSRDIANTLVKSGIAEKIEDVNSVLQNGFFHLYGAQNTYY